MNRPTYLTKKLHHNGIHSLKKREKLAIFSHIAQNVSDIIFRYRIGEEPGFEYINPVVYEVTGYSPDEFYADPSLGWRIMHPADRPLWESLASGKSAMPVTLMRFFHKDGQMLWLEFKTVLACDPEGEPLAFECVARDITARRRAEESVLQSEAALTTFLQNSPIAIAISTQKEGRYLYANDIFLQTLGYTQEEVIGATSRELGVWGDEVDREEITSLFRQERSVHSGDARLRTKSGELIHSLLSLELIDFKGQACVLAMLVDITQLKQTQTTLKETNQKLEALFNASPLGIIALDVEGKVTLWSHSAEAMFGYSAEEVIGRQNPIIDDDKILEFRDLIRRVSAGERLRDVELVRRRKDGSPINISISTAMFVDANDQVSGLMALVNDIEARKRTDAILLQNAATARALLNAPQDIAFLVDLDGAIIEVNDNGAKWFDRSAAGMIGLDVFTLTSPTIAVDRRERFEQVKHTGQPLRFQDERNGIIWDHSYYPVKNADGIVNSIAIFSRDVTNTQRSEQVQAAIYHIAQATNATNNLQELFSSIHEVLGTLMPAQNFFIALYDPAFETLSFPYFVDEVDPPPVASIKLDRGLTGYVLRTGKSLLASPEVFEQLVIEGQVESVGAPSIDWLGVPLIVRNEVIGVLAVQSYTMGIRYSQDDMSILEFVSNQIGMAIDRKRNEEVLRISESRYRAIVEDQTDLIIRFKEDYTLTFVNEAFCRFFQVRREDWVGKSYLPLLGEDERRRSETYMKTLTRHHPLGTIEHSQINAEGEVVWLQWTDRALFDEQGNFIEYQSVGRDITEEKQRQSEMEAIVTVTTALRSARTRAEMLPVILDQLSKLLRIEGAVLAIYEPSRSEIRVEMGRSAWQNASGRRIPFDQGITGQVIRSGRPYIEHQTNGSLHITDLDLNGDMTAVACVPLIAQEQTIGVIWVGKRSAINPNDLRLLTAIADIAANAIHRASLHEQTQQRLQRLTGLRSIDLAISASLDLTVTLSMLIDQIISQLGIHAADILLYDPFTQMLEYSAGQGFRSSVKRKTRVRIGDNHAGRVALERRMEIVTNLDEVSDSMTVVLHSLGENFKTYIAIPLIAKGQVKGVLQLFHRTALETNPEWLEYLQALAAQAAIAIDNAELFEKLQRSNSELTLAYDATIEGWSRALELRDQETEGHTRRVADLTLGLIETMGVTGLELEHVRRGVLLHDIGKMAIPDRILLKPGALDPDEWVIMRKHPTYAYELLSPIPYLRRALDIPYYHHEKWDGGGYPHGLKGEQIPLAARIFAVVDVWDALTSDRPYRMRMSDDTARAIIEEQSGKHFDPRVVKAFLAFDRMGFKVRKEL